MIFVLSKLGWALVRPGNLLALMLILGLMFQATRRPPFQRLGKSWSWLPCCWWRP